MFHVKQDGFISTGDLSDDVGLSIWTPTPPWSSDSPCQRISVEHSRSFGGLYRLDGAAMAAEGDEFMIHESLAHIAVMEHSRPSHVLILGGGDGCTTRELLKHTHIERIHIAELDPEVVRTVVKHLPQLPAGAFDDPRVVTLFGDAATSMEDLTKQGKAFDLIFFDLTESDDPACAHLHDRAFLHRCAESLRPGGLIQIQLGSPFYQGDKVRTLYHRLTEVFASVCPSLINVPLYGGPWLLALASPTRRDFADPAHLAEEWARRSLHGLRYYNPDIHLAARALPGYIRDLIS